MEGRGPAASPLERALLELASKSCAAPALLEPADLDALRAVAGDSALEYVLVCSAFHFINRIADLLHVDPEALPAGLRRFEKVRRIGVSVAARIMRRLDLGNRSYGVDFESACRDLAEAMGAPAAAVERAFASARARPQIIEAVRLAVEERDTQSSLDRATLHRVHAAAAAALPASPEEAEGFHSRPADPVEAFAFVGTRYPARTTRQMIERLRSAGYGDVAILDLAVAVADANQWARMHRLLGFPPGVYDLSAPRPSFIPQR